MNLKNIGGACLAMILAASLCIGCGSGVANNEKEEPEIQGTLPQLSWSAECFADKLFVVYGDSITYGARVSDKRSLYINRLSEKCGFRYKSFAVSGSTLAHGNDAQQKNGSGVQYVFENADYNRQADYALIFYGANDFSHNVRLGSGEKVSGTYSSVSEYKDGMLYVYESLKSCNKDMGIIFITPIYRADIPVNGLGLRMSAYDDAVREMCGKLGCYYVDLENLFDADNFGEGSRYTPDKLHPNDEGHALIYTAMLERGISIPEGYKSRNG